MPSLNSRLFLTKRLYIFLTLAVSRTSNSTRFVMYRRFSVLSFYFIFKNVSTEWLMEIIFFPRPCLRRRSVTEVENYFIVCSFVLFFEMQRLFIILMFLRKQSGNSLANWWSVCFKMFFPNGFICVVASTGSATDCGKFIGLGNKMSSL